MILFLISMAVTAVALGLLLGSQLRHRRCTQLVAQAAHEIRGPLTLLGFGLYGIGSELRQDDQRLVQLEREFQRIRLGLDDLAAARTRRKADQAVAQIDLREFVRDLSADWQPIAALHGRAISVVAERSAEVMAAPLRLRQACCNLLTNALEHGAGPIELRVDCSLSSASITVVDQGGGLTLPLDSLVRRARGRRGSRGHGLAVVDQVARAHRGSVKQVTADPGALCLELPTS